MFKMNLLYLEGLKNFDFRIHIFGKSGKSKSFKWDCKDDFSILKDEAVGGGWGRSINNNEIDSLTVDGYVHLHCFFNNINEC